jgi:hypothetical protein
MARHHHDLYLGALSLDVLQQIDPARAAQAQIEQNHRQVGIPQGRLHLTGPLGYGDAATSRLEDAPQGPQQKRLVIDQQDQGFPRSALPAGSGSEVELVQGFHIQHIGPDFGTLECPECPGSETNRARCRLMRRCQVP